jgi:membrane protease YdiL (CAAX protease family)
MDKKKLPLFGLIIFAGLLIYSFFASRLIDLILPDASLLLSYLLNKGLFVVLILAAMNKTYSLKFFGLERGSSWWFLLPGLPFLLLTVGIFFEPNATFGLSIPATVGWVFVAIFVGIGEETVFRGILWRAFETRGVMFTAFATSALFGLVHLIGLMSDIPWQIITSQAVFAFGVGMTFAAIRLVSGSVMAPLVLHAVFDAGALIAAGGVTELFNDSMSVERLLIPGVIFALWGTISILIIQKRRAGFGGEAPGIREMEI